MAARCDHARPTPARADRGRPRRRPHASAEWRAVAERYAIAVPPALAALIDPDDPDDPIARQFLPDARELDRAPHELDDPIGDDAEEPHCAASCTAIAIACC